MEEVAISPTTELLSRRPTDWRTIIPKKFLHCCESSRAQQISQLGDLAKGLRTPREFDFEGQWDLNTELPQDWVNRILGTNKTLCALGPRRKEQ